MLKKSNRGVSMIEALIGLVVLALGVLALARLQIGNAGEARHASARGTAVQMANELRERMVINRAARTADPTLNPYRTAFEVKGAAAKSCIADLCSAAELAAWDLAQWKAELAAKLPGGDAAVFNVPGDATQFAVLIAWQDLGTRNEGQTQADGRLVDVALFDDADSVWHDLASKGSGIQNLNCPRLNICHLAHIRP
jgi:type IV pilus assembly protein PilV